MNECCQNNASYCNSVESERNEFIEALLEIRTLLQAPDGSFKADDLLTAKIYDITVDALNMRGY